MFQSMLLLLEEFKPNIYQILILVLRVCSGLLQMQCSFSIT